MSSKPIRIALVGLSANAITSWAAKAHLPYLQSARGQTQYRVVALLNSSKEAAEQARSQFNLPSDVRTYGDPAQLAADEEVDLVSIVVRSDKHYAAMEPAFRAGKALYVEWPLTESLERSLALVGEKKGRDTNIIGLQGRLSPVASKVKEVIASGRIGKVLNSQVRGFSAMGLGKQPGTLLEGPMEEMFSRRAMGGNHFSILYAHMIDLVHSVLGEFKDFHSKLQIRWPELSVIDKAGVQLRTRKSDVPDLISAHGELAPGAANVQEGATLSVLFRSGAPFKGEAPYTWYIQGQTGELKITSPFGPTLQASTLPGVKIELHDYITDQVTEITWESEWKDWQKELEMPGCRMVGDMYNRYALWSQQEDKEAVPAGGEWPTFDVAIRRHEELDRMLKEFDKTSEM